MSDTTTGQRHAPSPHDRYLTRDVAVTVIPAGFPDNLLAGTRVTITHRLGGNFTEEAIWNQLKTVFDPEIPVNIVDLGLVYSLKVEPLENSTDRHCVTVAMTLTAPGCGMGPVIAEDARNRVLTIPGVNEAKVDIVWDPPWTQTMISEEGKMKLGLI